MTITEWLKLARERIDTLDAELIALAVFAPEGADRSWLAAHNVVKITTDMAEKAEKMLQRREEGEPLAYILGEKEFYGRNFKVDRRVLIPRPETEVLIDLIKELSGGEKVRILELGTGSGCIAVTLALELPQAKVLATDVSSELLEVAEGNMRNLGAKVDLFQADLLKNARKWPSKDEMRYDGGNGLNALETPQNGLLGQNVDILVANLPYVDRSWEWLDERSLGYEPSLALYAEKRGLELYEKMFEQLKKLSIPYVIIEADPCQHDELVRIAKESSYKKRKICGFGLVFEKV